MKNNILMLFAVLISNVAFSQNQTSGHLTFKGVPIDGTLAGYVAKMKQNGFTHISSESGLALLKGDFAGYKECIVGVSTLKDIDLVYKVAVLFPDKVKFDRCKYYSVWQTDKGEIQLMISHNDVSSCYVTLAYFDNINSEKIRKNAKDDL
jgi:hypothetical protein